MRASPSTLRFWKKRAEGKVITVEANFGWSDVGSWAAVHRMMDKDVHGNAGNGRWMQIGAKNCLIHSPDRLVVLLGIDNAVVVIPPMPSGRRFSIAPRSARYRRRTAPPSMGSYTSNNSLRLDLLR